MTSFLRKIHSILLCHCIPLTPDAMQISKRYENYHFKLNFCPCTIGCSFEDFAARLFPHIGQAVHVH